MIKQRVAGDSRLLDSDAFHVVVRSVTLSMVLLLMVTSLAFAGVSDACPPLAPNNWAKISVPAFSDGNQIITEYEVSSGDPNILFVTNGRVVLSSTDGGCSFGESFNLGNSGLDFDLPSAAITDLLLASNDGSRAYLTVTAKGRVTPPDLPGGLPSVPPVDLPIDQPHVVLTTDGGDTWGLNDAGLENAAGAPLSIALTPGSDVAYLLVDEEEVKQDPLRFYTPQTIYSSSSGGAWQNVWQAGNPGVTQDGTGARVFSGLEADPRDPLTLWAYGPGGLYKSTDGGVTLARDTIASGLAPTGFSGLETFGNAQGVTELIAFPTGIAQGLYSSSGGNLNWLPFADPEPIESAALAPGLRFATATASGVVYYHFPQMPGQLDISEADEIFGLEAVLSGKTSIIYGRTLNSLVRRAAPEPPPEPPWDFPEPEPLPGYDLPPFDPMGDPPPAKLVPAKQTVELQPGETRTLQYRLLIPGAISADVVFLPDTTGTMLEEIEGLKAALGTIVKELGAKQIYAHFGLGQYRSYTTPPSYETMRNIGPPDEDFRSTLDDLTTSGGDHIGSEQETGLAALFNIATGQGNPTAGQFIAGGQQMKFRDGILHVIVHGTDEEPSEAFPNPSVDTVVGALKSVGARHVGLAYVNSGNALSQNAGPPTESLSTLSRLTNAFAMQDVDCTGDGLTDVFPGQPLVCEIPPGEVTNGDSLGKAIANLIMSLPDKRAVRLEFEGDTDALVGVLPTVDSAVDFRVPQVRIFDVTVTCPSGYSGSRFMGITATARGAGIADAELEVVCNGAPIPQPQPRPPVPMLVLPVQNPLPPPQPPTVTTTVNQIQAQTQAQSQAQAQAGLVTQRQAQPQVAMVKVLKPSLNVATVDGQGTDDLAFSSYSRKKHSDLPQQLLSYFLACAMGTAFGLLIRRRLNTVPQTVRVQRPPTRRRER